ncbi:hypothetical protein H4R35_006049 [Dimargaris xerosporica]|nr:hypothetical protein H4R35_006049 [Dimargaris xerosporica]
MTRTAILPLAAEAAENPAHTRSKPKRDESTAGANPTADEPGDGALNPQQQLGLLSLPVELLLRHILPRLSYYDMDQLRAATRLSLALIQDVKCCHGGEHPVFLSRDIERIFEVIEAFLEMLNSPNLLDNFRTIVMQALRKQQGSRGHASNHQEVWFRDMLYSRDFDAFIHRFWLEVIGGGNIDQLRYYFKAMLAISAIPCILNMMLPANNYDKALALAKRIHLIPGFIDVI